MKLSLTEISPGWVRIVFGEMPKDGAHAEYIEIVVKIGEFQNKQPLEHQLLATIRLAALDRARDVIVSAFQDAQDTSNGLS